MQNKTSRYGRSAGFGSLIRGRHTAAALARAAIVGAVFLVKSAAADPVTPLPSGDFMMNATFCPGSVSFSECSGYTVDGGYWIFNSDGSVTRLSNGVQAPGSGVWDEIAPGHLSVEFFSEDGCWLSSLLADQTSGGDFPCFEGLQDDLDIGVLSVRLCLEP